MSNRQAADARYYAANKERVKNRTRRWAIDNREKTLRYGATFRKANKKKLASKNLEYKYGITAEQRDAALEAQGKKCASCKSPDPGVRGWHVDHDHGTGKFRGILCRGCNHALGNVSDSLERLQQLIEYLKRNKE